jgi:hypothetical protein
MAKPITVAEDEALKFYRLKNILTPPAIVELSELDREMSDILSRNDISSQEKAQRYHSTLVKYRNLYKDFFPSESTIKVEKTKEKEKEKKPSEPIPFIIPQQTEKEMEEEDEIEEMEEKKEKEAEETLNFSIADISLIPRAQKLESEISKRINFYKKGGYVFVFDPEKKSKRRRAPSGLWNKSLNYLALSRSTISPTWRGKRQKKFVEFLTKTLISNKIVNKGEIEKFPNVAHTFENMSRSSSTVPSYSPSKGESPSKIDFNESLMTEDEEDKSESKEYEERFTGTGINVKFNKWNHSIHGH